jgi:L-fuculose-phosphate aldolase
MHESALREAVCDAGRRLHARNLVAATDGNISVRLPGGLFLVTPSGVSKADLEPDALVVADAAGTRVSGGGRVSSEFLTHLAAYEERPDIQAVVHAHPPCAVALTLAGRDLRTPLLPELVMGLGPVPTAPYATPGTPEGAASVRGVIRHADAVLMDRHGSLAVGHSVLDAYFKTEKLEHAAETLFRAFLLGDPRPLNADELARIDAARAAYLAPPLP